MDPTTVAAIAAATTTSGLSVAVRAVYLVLDALRLRRNPEEARARVLDSHEADEAEVVKLAREIVKAIEEGERARFTELPEGELAEQLATLVQDRARREHPFDAGQARIMLQRLRSAEG